MSWIEEVFKTAMKGVCYASHLTRDASFVSSVIKKDRSLVSLYDVSIQMIFCYLFRNHPSIDILSEEENNKFYQDTLSILQGTSEATTEEQKYILGFLTENSLSLTGTIKSVLHTLEKTDRLTLVLDPIDGTKGFISGRSYSTVVSAVQSGKVLFSIIASPREGVVYYKCTMGETGLDGYPHRRRVKVYSLRSMYSLSYSSFLESLPLQICTSAESSHSSPVLKMYLERMRQIYPISVHSIDGQTKYAYVSTQKMDLFIRIPDGKIDEKIWDHCAGIDMNDLSIVTDLLGNPLHPCTPPGYGVVACHSANFHNISIEILRKLLM